MTIQELIGPHPQPPHIYGEWWSFIDLPITDTKKHRALTEIYSIRDRALNQMAQWIVKYHLNDAAKSVIEKKRSILERNDLSVFIDKLNILPLEDKTRKGNLGEITLIEYLKESKRYDPLIYKLHYNPNFNQSMKGDDVLLFNKNNLEEEVVYGECKYRTSPSKKVILDIVENLQGIKSIPISILFVANCLYNKGEKGLADRLIDVQIKVTDGVIPITNVGFLISTKSPTPSSDTNSIVENHLSANNQRLVMLSLGVDDPQQIVDEAYSRADAILKSK